MKYENQISRLAVLCGMCLVAFSGAHGAASVRSLGGTGTYSGTSAASSASTATTSAARAGSMRVTPTATTSGAATSAAATSATTGRVATSPRLSIGKYLGGGTSVSGGSSIKNQKPGGTTVSGGNSGGGDSMDPDVAGDRLSALEKIVYGLRGDNKYIILADNEISLDVGALRQDLGGAGGEVNIWTDDTGIYWQYDGADEKLLVAWDTLKGKLGAIDADALDAAVADAVDKAGLVRQSDLDGYAKTEDIPDIPENLVTTDSLTDYLTENKYVIEGAVSEYLTTNNYVTQDNITTEINKEITNQFQDGDSVIVKEITTQVQNNLSVSNDQIKAPDGDGPQMLGAVEGEVQWLKIVTEEDI